MFVVGDHDLTGIDPPGGNAALEERCGNDSAARQLAGRNDRIEGARRHLPQHGERANEARHRRKLVDDRGREVRARGARGERGGHGDMPFDERFDSRNRGNWQSTLNRYKQGDRVPVTVRRFHRTLDLTIHLGPPDDYEYKIEEIPNASAEAKRLRAAWLDGN